MGWESSDMVRFDIEPSFKVKRGQPNLNGFITGLLLILEVCNVKPTCRILWAGNLLMSDLTFGPSFKVKQWFSGFGELSFRWIQICIGSPMCRSSWKLLWLFLKSTLYKNHFLSSSLGSALRWTVYFVLYFWITFAAHNFCVLFCFHLYSETQNTQLADTEPVHGHWLLVHIFCLVSL